MYREIAAKGEMRLPASYVCVISNEPLLFSLKDFSLICYPRALLKDSRPSPVHGFVGESPGFQQVLLVKLLVIMVTKY
jgi:hypothetical protein